MRHSYPVTDENKFSVLLTLANARLDDALCAGVINYDGPPGRVVCRTNKQVKVLI